MTTTASIPTLSSLDPCERVCIGVDYVARTSTMRSADGVEVTVTGVGCVGRKYGEKDLEGSKRHGVTFVTLDGDEARLRHGLGKAKGLVDELLTEADELLGYRGQYRVTITVERRNE